MTSRRHAPGPSAARAPSRALAVVSPARSARGGRGLAPKPRPSPNQRRPRRPVATPPSTRTSYWLRPPQAPPRAMRKGAGGSRRSRVAGSGPGAGPVLVPGPGPGPGRSFCPRSRRCPRPLLPLLPLLALAAAAAIFYSAWSGGERDTGPPLPVPSEQGLRALLGQLDPTRLWVTFLRPLLRERVPGGPGSHAARQHIVGRLVALGATWHLELDAFEAVTPRGPVTFTNVVATAATAAPRRLVLACHYDTKVLPPGLGQQVFLGATDSAVPCAILLELAAALDQPLRRAKDRGAEVTLQLLFLDGEEAFGDWSATDSLYGARHLAAQMATTRHGPHGTQLTAMSLLVLLDLLGARHPAIHSHFTRTHHWFLRLVAIEQRLRRLGLLHAAPQDQPFFRLSPAPGPVEDDHVPFLQRGVPILHLIPTPFPRVWHTLEDTEDNLHPPTVEDLCKILVTFVAEFLQL
ncbi:LOW QUALITY PROTEIN: glutaminyl-peptide cyclotransferase-like protein [Falco naumanni]|uniref:LOW QUALITY PROTEIN: glutaminyl-peptide cyclotransferase-like protein n=1 Tax=Falco naumanni TaxID=148594 RepID=UPI001ADE2760|nr:LOW QUALITY PROTEIN: glutaminyl-peptide cyclotransferase-like protein [Falco naumanni]